MSATGGGGGGGSGGSQEEDKKPVDQTPHINLKVKGQVYLYLNLYIILSCLMVITSILFVFELNELNTVFLIIVFDFFFNVYSCFVCVKFVEKNEDLSIKTQP